MEKKHKRCIIENVLKDINIHNFYSGFHQGFAEHHISNTQTQIRNKLSINLRQNGLSSQFILLLETKLPTSTG